MSLHLRQGECFGCGGSRWGDSREWRSYGSGFTVAGRLCWCSRVPPGVVGVAHSRMLRVGGNRGIMRNSTISNGHGLAPMRRPHLTAHGSPTTTHHAHQKSSSFQQKLASASRRPRSPMCNTNDNHTHHDTPTTPLAEIGPLPARDRSNSARPTRRRSTHDKLRGQSHMPHLRTVDEQQTRGSTTDLNAKLDRSRGGTGPISARVTTDLAAEPDRSRRGGGEGMTKGRAGPRAARPLGVGRRRREETATPPPLVLFPCQAREMREASSTCSGVGRTPV